MDKLELKQHISRKAFETYDTTLETQREMQEDAANDTFDMENDAGEMSDDSNRLEALDDIEQKAQLLDEREEERLALGRLIPVLHEEVTLGSVILTDQRNFFVGGSVPTFEVDGVEYIGISEEAPIFQALQGKKTGDTVEFRGTTYHIQEVF